MESSSEILLDFTSKRQQETLAIEWLKNRLSSQWEINFILSTIPITRDTNTQLYHLLSQFEEKHLCQI